MAAWHEPRGAIRGSGWGLTLVYIVPVLAAIAFGLYMLLGILLAVGSALTP